MYTIQSSHTAGVGQFQSRAAPTTQASIVASVVAFAIARGVPYDEIYSVTGLSMTELVDPDARLPERTCAEVWRVIGARFPGEAIALQMAEVVPSSFFGPLSYALQHATDLRALLQVLVRYRGVLSTGLDLELIESHPSSVFTFSHPMDTIHEGYGAESGMALARKVIGDHFSGMATRIDFSHSPLGPMAVYTDFFGVPVRFHQPCNAMEVRTESLDWPNPRSDQHQYHAIRGYLDLVRTRLVGDSASAEMTRIREAITANAERSEYAVDQLARTLGMGLRSLQRIARRENTTIRELLDEARLADARRLLGDSSHSIEQVSVLLGYSAESAFRRAFRRWTGKSPAQHRRENR